jgi:hypothetical protein
MVRRQSTHVFHLEAGGLGENRREWRRYGCWGGVGITVASFRMAALLSARRMAFKFATFLMAALQMRVSIPPDVAPFAVADFAR